MNVVYLYSHITSVALQRRRHAVVQPAAETHTVTVAQRAVHPNEAARRLPHVRASRTEQQRAYHCEYQQQCLMPLPKCFLKAPLDSITYRHEGVLGFDLVSTIIVCNRTVLKDPTTIFKLW